MGVDQVVILGRMVLHEVLVLAGPALLVAVTVSLVVNVFQVLTSLQDTTISTVARILATGAVLFVGMPWMWQRLSQFTFNLFTNFRAYLQ